MITPEIKPFTIMEAPLNGINLVEASAGTGKTWNIEALTVRLMVERRMLPGEILVVTFTEAATQELRERIYKRLIEVIRVLKYPETCGNDPFLQACVRTYGGAGTATDTSAGSITAGTTTDTTATTDRLRHLEQCKQRFDEAAISTIHGFCKTVLSEFSHLTLTGVDVDIETQGPGALIDDAVDDFWRLYNATEATLHGAQLSSLLYGPLKRDQLRKSMNVLLKQPDAEIMYPDEPEWLAKTDLRGMLDQLIELTSEIRANWQTNRDTIRQQLFDTKISRVSYEKNFNDMESNLLVFLDRPIDFEPGNKGTDPQRFGARFIRDGKLNKGAVYRSEHPVHVLIDQAMELAAYIPEVEQRRALDTIRRLYRERCARDGVTTFDDLLRNLAEALRDDASENGGSGALHAGLRQRYKAGLIDEFQDTDAVQFEIFRRMFIDNATADRLLYLIGDPKQAIYKFRGADLRTYIKARRMVSRQFTLDTNFRSAQNMVDGVNALFKGEYAFIDPELVFQPATAAHTANPFVSQVDAEAGANPSRDLDTATNPNPSRDLDTATNPNPSRDLDTATNPNPSRDLNQFGLHFPKIGDEPFTSKTGGTRAVTNWTVHHIARSLESARRGQQTGFRQDDGTLKPLSAGDIAVLVSSNFQARMMKSGLEALGVPAVVGGDASVFSTDDARLVNLMLDVLVDPQRLSVIRTLLTSRLVGMNVVELEALMCDDLAWSGKLDIFARARTIALEKGVLSGIRYILDALEVEKKIISWSDGERRITNLRHLTELLYDEQRRGFRNLAGLAQWLRTRRNDPDQGQSDATQIRLESDENRVSIMTMHSSKGLQFPVVYAPYLWETRKKSADLALYVDAGRDRFVLDLYNATTKRLLSVRGEDDTRAREGLRTQDAENMEDRVRLMYVAVTRSRYRCYVPYTQVDTTQTRGFDSPFTAMLLRDPAAGSVQWRNLTDFDRTSQIPADDLITGLLSQLDTTRFCMYRGQSDHRVRYMPEASVRELHARRLDEKARSAMQQHVFVESYSSLKDRISDAPARQSSGMGTEVAVSTALAQEEVAQASKAPQNREAPSLEQAGRSVFTFPRGAQTGTFWHYIMETIDFAEPSAFEEIVRRACGEYGFDADTWSGVLLPMVRNVVGTNLGDFRMADVPANRSLREMEFYMPYDDQAMTDYQQWILEQMGTAGHRMSAPGRTDIRLYLTGFIDLLVEHNGKFYILDYKSDYLGDTLEDYAPEALRSHMTEKRYIMQYYFYALALYRFLEVRLGTVDFDAVFGGVYYLFLRGMDGTAGHGVFADRPDPAKIAAFADRLQPARDTGRGV